MDQYTTNRPEATSTTRSSSNQGDYLLSLETTEKFGSVALIHYSGLVSQKQLPQDRRSAQTLAVAVDAILRESDLVPRRIGTLAVVAGPGSFTGLRVGIATAKMFAYAVGADVIAVGTFETVAEAFSGIVGAPEYLCIGVDAQRGEVVVQQFRRSEEGRYVPLEPPKMIPATQWWTAASRDKDLLFTGPALDRWHVRAPEHVRLADPDLWHPKAAVAGKLALEKREAGLVDDLWTLQPIYSRLSAAEERLVDIVP